MSGPIERRLLPPLIVVWVLTGGLALAQSPPPPVQALTIQSATQIGFARSPQIQKALLDIVSEEGSRREAAGSFDTTLQFTPSIEYAEGYLSPTSVNNENKRRTQLRELAAAMGKLRESLYTAINRKSSELPVCPTGYTRYVVELEGQSIPQDLCIPYGFDPTAFLDQNDPETYAAANNPFLPPPKSGLPGNPLDFQRSLAKILGYQVDSLSEDLKQRGLELVQQNYRLATETEQRAQLALARLGEFPVYEFQKTAALDISWTRATRHGSQYSLGALFEGIEDNYKGKLLDPRFGGKGVQTVFRSTFDFTFIQPLKRGRGKIAAAAPERAARLNAEAARLRYRHTVAEQTLSAAEGYFDLLAAQQSLEFTEQSFTTQRKLVEGTRLLMRAGESARSDLTRVEARAAEMESNVGSARIALLAARARLAETLGLRVDETRASLASAERFPDTPLEVAAPAVEARLVSQRADLRSARSLRESARLLFDAARADTRSKLDLAIKVGMAADYFSPYFRVLKDEFKRDPNEPTESPVDYFSTTGFSRSFSSHFQPQYAVQISFELPFGNRRARGRMAQAAASLRQSEVQASDLERTIGASLVERGAAAERARQELLRRKEAVGFHEASWKATQELRAAGELSLIDALATEQALTQARLALVTAQRDYAKAVAGLRFEMGQLVTFRDDRPTEALLSDLVTTVNKP
ncbi:MAG: TolC family protein [Vicinamibacteria bacterium]|jgi:outer membrane protein TolC|nr:TolC family protein [Vicinamibacteria bacterium]